MAPSKKAPAKKAAAKKAVPAGKTPTGKSAAKKTASRAGPDFYKADLREGKGGLEVSARDHEKVRKTAPLKQAFNNGSKLRFTLQKPRGARAAAAPVPLEKVVEFLQSMGDVSFALEITCIEKTPPPPPPPPPK